MATKRPSTPRHLLRPVKAGNGNGGKGSRSCVKGVFALLVAVALAGCALPPYPEREDDYRLWMGGVHYRFVDDATVEAEGHVINIGSTTFNDSSFELRWALSGRELDFPNEVVWQGGKDWAPGEPRQWTVVFQDIVETTFSFSADVTEDAGWWGYVIPCLDRHGAPSDACTFPGPPDRITPAKESQSHDRLLECCEWLPPPFDAYDLSCAVRLRDLACTVVVWNHAQTTEAASAEVLVHALPVEGVTGKQLVAKRVIELGDTFAPGEHRSVEFVLEDALSGVTGEPSSQYEVEICVSRAEMPKSVANATFILSLAAPSSAETNRPLGGLL